MMNKYLWPFTTVLCLVALLFVSFRQSSPRLAFVKSSELVSKYKGMQEARVVYKAKMSQWQSNIDTLQAEYQKAMSQYNSELAMLSSSVRKEKELQLNKQRLAMQEYAQTLEQKAREEDDKMTTAVINQINSYVEQYGKDNGYKYIFGTTQQGNILYGDKGEDITEDILQSMNEVYKK